MPARKERKKQKPDKCEEGKKTDEILLSCGDHNLNVNIYLILSDMSKYNKFRRTVWRQSPLSRFSVKKSFCNQREYDNNIINSYGWWLWRAYQSACI